MDTYPIIWIPAPALRETAQPVENVDDALRLQMDRMLETMYEAPGIGLAANQVNILNRVLVMDVSRREAPDSPRQPICMVNPEVIWKSGEPSVMEEGCLSIPDQFAEVQRPAVVRVKYLDYNGHEAELEAEGLLSHCVQHEIDHLDGVLFIDYLSKLKRDMIVRKVKKIGRDQQVL